MEKKKYVQLSLFSIEQIKNYTPLHNYKIIEKKELQGVDFSKGEFKNRFRTAKGRFVSIQRKKQVVAGKVRVCFIVSHFSKTFTFYTFKGIENFINNN